MCGGPAEEAEGCTRTIIMNDHRIITYDTHYDVLRTHTHTHTISGVYLLYALRGVEQLNS